MNIGKLNKQIIIQNTTQTRDINGGVVSVWADYLTCWSTPRYNFGREHEEEQRETSMTSVEFTIRKDTSKSITEAMRINFEGEYYYIQNIFNYPTNDMQLLKTQKRY